MTTVRKIWQPLSPLQPWGTPKLGRNIWHPRYENCYYFIKTLKKGRRKKENGNILTLSTLRSEPQNSCPCMFTIEPLVTIFFTRMPEVYWFCSFLFQLIVLWLEFADIELFEWVYEERRRMTLFDERRHQKAASQIRFTLIEQFMHSKKGFQLRTYFCNFLNFFFFC